MNMTSIYLSGSLGVQKGDNGISSRMAGWITHKLADFRARRSKLQTVSYLRNLDRATLDDIGVDVRVLNSPIAMISRSNSCVVVLTRGGGTRLINV